ncbi:MAG: hypothetical protein EHM48_05240 [Planctomycetaceae bacterium]|nr:MAG: hypothetical protein EHM48_05240 [Planctomycetaceae bacterium]
MKNGKTVSVLALTAVLGLLVAAAWGQLTTQDVRKIAQTLRPYQILNGQVSAGNYEIIYILDGEAQKLAALKYDPMKRQLVAIASRDLAKDFNSKESGGFSMISTQLSNQTGLLYITDYATHKAISYNVDLNNNTITPQQPFDMDVMFRK